MHETSAEFRPSFSLSFSDLSPALRPLNLPEKRAFKAERTREAGITMSNLVTRDRISRSIIPPSSYLFIKPLLTIRTRAVRFEISDCIETDVSHLAQYHTPVSNHFL